MTLATRREVLASASAAGALAALSGSGGAVAAQGAPIDDVRAALAKFVAAFENCDLPAMEQAFAEDAVCFDPVNMTKSGSPQINLDDFRRKEGLPPGMRRIAVERPKQNPGPPYLSLKPLDLLIQMGDDMAVCTFHLASSPTQLSRRTIVMARRAGAWKIIHIHASNAAVS